MAKRKNSDIIQDTGAGDMMLDLNAPDEDKTIEGLLRLDRKYTPSDNMTVSFRMPMAVFNHAKELARELSVEKKKDIHYQRLMVESFLRVHPMKKEENED